MSSHRPQRTRHANAARAGTACLLTLLALLPALSASVPSSPAPVTVQPDGRTPRAWRELSAEEEHQFHLGHAVFNTTWIPAGEGSGQRDGVGPLFNVGHCDGCHNSRRRGRGARGDGPAPVELVMQVGEFVDGQRVRFHPRFGHIINTAALTGFTPEAEVTIHYRAVTRTRADGSEQTLWQPEYQVIPADGQPLPDTLVLMPRLASHAQGVGLLEQIPEQAIVDAARPRPGRPQGTLSWLDTPAGRQLGRFGWQATEHSVASQIAVAFAREMGLTNPMIDTIDCAPHDHACRNAPTGGTPEVAAELFDAVVLFQQLEAVRRPPDAAARLAQLADGERLFHAVGCGDCHRASMPIHDGSSIAPYTDLLLHDLGDELADRTLAGTAVPGRWRTAPLWGLSTAQEGARVFRLLHDGRARSVDEAIGWHGGSAAAAREGYERLPPEQRQRLAEWVSSL